MTLEELTSWLQKCDLDEAFIKCNFLHDTMSSFEGHKTYFYYSQYVLLTRPFDIDKLRKKEEDILSDYTNQRINWGILIQKDKKK